MSAPDRVWFYRNVAGAVVAAVARHDGTAPDGTPTKDVRPWTFARRAWNDRHGKRHDVTGWHCTAPPSPRPLYGLDRLAARPDAPVVATEGERAADAAAELFPDHVAITSMGGAHAAAKADWSPLAGRDVVIWRDHDEAGARYASQVAELCMRAGAASVRAVAVPSDWPAGWDVADGLPDGVPPGRLRAMLDAAKPVDAKAPEPDGRPPESSDEALAQRFTDTHGASLRFVATWAKWLRWTGAAWQPDETMHVFDLARATCRRASAACANPRIAAAVASAKTVAAVERLAKADRRHAATADQWDADPWLLNTPGGTVDLRTGKMRAHRPEDHLTKITPVAPGGACPLWRAFLAKVTNGDTELQAYLQRLAGYTLTGSIREHALFFVYGTGSNGKTVLTNALAGLLGGYAAVADMQTFTATSGDRHPTDVAMLRGARLVTAQETEQARRWAESRIKAMTGGDPITARFMRQDYFTFNPTFKLLIAGNHRPGIQSVDEGIRRRLHLIPFAVSIAKADRDEQLPLKLQAEWPGILAWAIDGCLEWQRMGLAPPAAVVSATKEYLDAEDAPANWLTECCIRDANLHSSSSALFASWRAYAEAAGEHVGSQKAFSQRLVAQGFVAKRLSDGRAAFLGLGLKARPQEPWRYGEPRL
jgi:putative DNA primase/helicase